MSSVGFKYILALLPHWFQYTSGSSVWSRASAHMVPTGLANELGNIMLKTRGTTKKTLIVKFEHPYGHDMLVFLALETDWRKEQQQPIDAIDTLRRGGWGENVKSKDCSRSFNSLTSTCLPGTHAHTLKPLSTQQGSGSAPVQQWFNLALNNMEHDSSFRQMSIYVTDDADSEAAIHCVISWGFEGLRFYMWKGTHNRYMQSSECAHTYGYLKKLFWAN